MSPPHIEIMIFGALIMFFLIVEPHGLARLWRIAKEKLRSGRSPIEGQPSCAQTLVRKGANPGFREI